MYPTNTTGIRFDHGSGLSKRSPSRFNSSPPPPATAVVSNDEDTGGLGRYDRRMKARLSMMTTTMNCEKPDSQMCLPANGRPVHTAPSVQPGYYNRYTTPSLFRCWNVIRRDGYLWNLIYFLTTCISTVPWLWCTK